MKSVDIIGIQLDLAAGTRGTNMGPVAIRDTGLVEDIRQLGYDCLDKGNLQPKDSGETCEEMKNYEQVNHCNAQLYRQVKDTLEQGHFPVVLGGDHSIAAGSASAVAKHYGKIGIIWVDAHGDWNDPASSPTGNMHGMPFSALCGAGPACMVDFGQDPVYTNPKNCVIVGGRDFDPLEEKRMQAYGVTVFSDEQVHRLGAARVMEQAIAIAAKGTQGVHVSFDVDAITPEQAPGTGLHVPGGITAQEALEITETAFRSQKLLSFDLVEVNPFRDVENTTAKLAKKLILSVLGSK